jgi:NAD-dependent SIR2 family protein deacetylase
MKVVIFTGAGAGKSDGIPLQTELFERFFLRPATNTHRAELVSNVAGFFRAAFGVDPLGSGSHRLPTFEEALGILDLAIAREDAIQGVANPLGNIAGLRARRRELILALAVVLAPVHHRDETVHARLVANLRSTNRLATTTFVTTNYDTLIDDAIDREAITIDRGTGSLIDYGMGGLTAPDQDPDRELRTFPCLKVHGSLNWLYCPACDLLDVTYASNGAIRLVDDPEAARCYECETLRTPIIVPPSYYKNLSNVYLAVVWTKAYHALRAADQLVFCGYSFPDADMHIKYLVKRAQLNRDRHVNPLQVALVNHFPGKAPDVAAAERQRFQRFLGNEVVDTRRSFQEFANAPLDVLMS